MIPERVPLDSLVEQIKNAEGVEQKKELIHLVRNAVFENKAQLPHLYFELVKGLTEEEKPLTTLVEGVFKSLYARDKTQVDGNVWTDIRSGWTTVNPAPKRITPEETDSIHDFIIKEKEKIFSLTRRTGQGVYFSTKHTGLARSLHFTASGQIFIHLNKKVRAFPPRDQFVVQGGEKKGILAYNAVSGEPFLSFSLSKEKAEREMAVLSMLRNSSQFLHPISLLERVRPDGSCKVRMLFPFLPRGDLHNAILEGSLHPREKILLALSLVRGLRHLHSTGIIHHDIKPGNIVIEGEEENIKGYIIDFGSCVFPEEEERKQMIIGTKELRSPEYVAAIFSGEEAIQRATTQAIDIWALGCTYAMLFSYEDLFSIHHPRREEQIIEFDAPAFYPRDQLKTMVAAMMQKDPFVRATLQEVEATLEVVCREH